MTHTPTITTTAEQEDALTARHEAYCTATGTSPTKAEFLAAQVVQPYIDSITLAAYEAAAARLKEGMRTAPYDTRKAIIAQLESQIA